MAEHEACLAANGRTPEWYRSNHRTPWVAGRVAGHGGAICPEPFGGPDAILAQDCCNFRGIGTMRRGAGQVPP